MPSFTGGNLGLSWGFIPHEDGWADSYNINFQWLDVLTQPSILEILSTPPGSPADDSRYIVGPTATGGWAGHEDDIAVYTKKEDPDSRDWVFLTPKEGWYVYNIDTTSRWLFDGANWGEVTSSLIPSGGTDGQVLTLVSGAPDWVDPASGLPAVGADGQVLTVVAGVADWADPVEELPAPGTDGQVLTLVSGAPDWADSISGSSYDFDDIGAWDGSTAYAAGNFVSFGGQRFFTPIDIDVPAGTPGVDGEVHAAGSSVSTLALPALTTAGNADTICIAVAYNSATAIITSITSAGGLPFTQKSWKHEGIISGHHALLELWTAPAGGELSGEVITVHLSASPTNIKAVAWGVYGGDPSDPFDANANSLLTGNGDRTAPGIASFSTSNANDLLIFIVASDSDGGAGLVANTAPSTWTLLNYQGNATNDNSANTINLAVSTKLVSSTQSAITISDGGDPSCWCDIAIAVKASGSLNPNPALDGRWILVDQGITNALLDAMFGTPSAGSILLKDASGDYSFLAPDANATKFLRNGGTGTPPVWDTPGGSGSAGGLFVDVMSAIPTQASTGLSTWVNQGSATVTDDADVGIVIHAPSNASANSLRLIKKTAPSTPYTATALVGLTGGVAGTSSLYFGWTDGTKIQAFALEYASDQLVRVYNFNSATSFNGTSHLGSTTGRVTHREWLRIQDDGTTVYFQKSADGKNFITTYSVAKASGFLGSSGYTGIVFGCDPFASETYVTLMSYEEA